MQSKVKRRKFGNTGLYVSEVSFGAMNLRMLDTLDEAYQILNYVLDQGVNLIDTARAYNGKNKQGTMVESEVLVGNAIRARTDLDEPIVIVTKGHGYTIPDLEEDLTTSLNKLGIEGRGDLRIGKNPVKLVHFIHGLSEERWEVIKKSGVLDKYQSLKEEGVINYIGFSSHYPFAKQIKETLDTGIFDVIELPYNIFNRSLGEDGEPDILKYAYEKGVGIINMKAFNGSATASIYHILKDYVKLDYRMMLNFCLSNPYITTVDAGARYIHEFEQDIEVSLGERLSSQDIIELKEEADKISDHMRRVCRECMHCMEKFECVQKIDFPGILSVYSRYTISEKLGKDTAQFIEQYKQFTLNAKDCIECEECLPWCEYKLNIPQMLKKAHQVLSSK